MDRQYIGKRLAGLRKARGLTQREVAEAIGVSTSAYSQYEIGAKMPRDDTKIAIARFFGRSIRYIFFDENTHFQ